MSEFFLIAPIELWNYENIVVQLHVENTVSAKASLQQALLIHKIKNIPCDSLNIEMKKKRRNKSSRFVAKKPKLQDMQKQLPAAS